MEREREEEEKLRKEVKASKKQWRAIRKQRFGFLDSDASSPGGAASTVVGSVTSAEVEEKKVED